MITALLVIIYIAFISLGLPDSILGSAWPSIYGNIGVEVSAQGILSMITAGGTIISSFLSDKVIRRFGTGTVTGVSVLLTAVALLGYSLSGSFYFLCLCAIPLGLGAGSVDVALNNFVANHYEARHMSWLHCFWGVGATLGPFIMSYYIGNEGGWRDGYRTIALLQLALVLVLFLSLPLWKKVEIREEEKGESRGKGISFRELISIKGVKAVLIALFSYTALEATTGFWGASFLVLSRGLSEEKAAQWISLFYMGITLGRFVSGFLTIKLKSRELINLGLSVIALGIALLILPLTTNILPIGFFLIGTGCAPIYPSILHDTPENFGKDVSQSLMGIQMGFAYIGTTFMPPLCGLIIGRISPKLYPYYLLIFLAAMVIMLMRLYKIKAKSPRANTIRKI
ncbi:MAG: MFS transporter [Clostridiaceae bacterium]